LSKDNVLLTYSLAIELLPHLLINLTQPCLLLLMDLSYTIFQLITCFLGLQYTDISPINPTRSIFHSFSHCTFNNFSFIYPSPDSQEYHTGTRLYEDSQNDDPQSIISFLGSIAPNCHRYLPRISRLKLIFSSILCLV
jgi:hypothetical protein